MALKQIQMSAIDLAVHEVMSSIPLEPGDMLLLGPQSVKLLSVEGAFKGTLPDKHIFKSAEWKSGSFNTEAGRPVYGKGKKATRK